MTAARGWTGLKHRTQHIGTKQLAHGGHLHFINDSKATNSASTAFALENLPGPFLWLAGGQLKKPAELDRLGPFMHNIKHAFLFGQGAEELKIFCNDHQVQASLFSTLPKAFGAALQKAETLKLRELTLPFLTLRRQL